MDVGRTLRLLALDLERRWDERTLRGSAAAPRFESHVGHGTAEQAVVRGRLLRGRAPEPARPGESALAAFRRTVAAFTTVEVPRERARVRLGGSVVEARTDAEGYLDVVLRPGVAGDDVEAGWAQAEVSVAGETTRVPVRTPTPTAGFGVISDLDDTIVETGVQRPLTMVSRTLTGSALTRHTFPGAPELYRALAAGPEGPAQHPVFYVSSSPWNLYRFLVAFLDHHGFPAGPLLLRDALGSGRPRSAREGKRRAIEEVLGTHPTLRFVLVGDSGEQDVPIYAEVARDHPGRVLAVYVHEVRDRTGGVVETALTDWPADVPVLLTRDFGAMSAHAARLGLADQV